MCILPFPPRKKRSFFRRLAASQAPSDAVGSGRRRTPPACRPFQTFALVVAIGLVAGRAPADERILPQSPQGNMWFGQALAVSADWLIVGAPKDHWLFKGSARILWCDEGVWEEQATLLADDGYTGDWFGGAVAIDDFVDVRAVVGAPYYDGYAGGAFVFVLEDGAWQFEAELVPSDGAANDYFGTSVALFDDLALVGAPGHDGPGPIAGLVYVFERSGSSWSQTGTITPDDALERSRFGSAIALGGLGAIAVIGADNHRHGGYPAPRSGSAYVFSRHLSGWTQDAELLPSDPWDLMSFGAALAVSGFGIRVVVGAAGTSTVDHGGSAYIFDSAGGSWSQVARLDSGAGEDRRGYGQAVAMAPTGEAVVVGDPYALDQDGTVFRYQRDGTEWRPLGQWRPELATTGAHVGESVGFWGAQALAGAPRDDDTVSGCGAVYVSEGLLFANGFESGDSSAWSSEVP